MVNKRRLNIFSYVGALFLVIGFITLRYGFHKEIYMMPLIMIAIGFVVIVTAAIKKAKRNEKGVRKSENEKGVSTHK